MQMNSNISIERKRIDCNALPKGWQREEVLRKSGISAGKVDVYYYSPTGKRIDSKPQLARHLGDAIDLSSFDFQKGKFILHLPAPSISLYRCLPGSGTGASASTSGSSGSGGGSSITIVPQTGNSLKRKHNVLSSGTTTSSSSSSSNVSASNTKQQQHLEFSRAMRTDVSLVPPIRQTASIFKQPVTVIRNHEGNKVKHDAKHGAQDKPKQLFWEKRLENMRACHATGEQFDDIVLPKSLKPLGPNIHEQTVMQSLATALHVLNTPVTGQTAAKTDFQKNAAAFINPDQPLMQGILISEDDIRRQEDRVTMARRKLQEALKA
ncbi:methyl-CpG-binding domain protein 2 isoform X1 [Stomoxys calcitrans]|uniref:methyl-CpG-binding domain protein 2 isoform X1 n=1 Tax=Stomoxys calcitrans TaxID=35570 RepID=UPI0027E33568|nr:methyl-CpG-binding domain protein 2 isoform X1 [Stomoxys calcitrans]